MNLLRLDIARELKEHFALTIDVPDSQGKDSLMVVDHADIKVASTQSISTFELHCTTSTCADDDELDLPPIQKLPVEAHNGDLSPLTWDDLTPCLRSLLPKVEGITYIIVQLKEIMKESFSGASAFAFESTIRINITNAKEAKEWLQRMQQHSKCTYRHSRGRKPGLKRVLYKVEMHCQHQRKPLTLKQAQSVASSRLKNCRKVLMHDLREKKDRMSICI